MESSKGLFFPSSTWLAGKSPMFNRKYMDSFMVDFPAVVMLGFGGVPNKKNQETSTWPSHLWLDDLVLNKTFVYMNVWRDLFFLFAEWVQQLYLEDLKMI